MTAYVIKFQNGTYYAGYGKSDARHVFCTTVDGANQYTFPLSAIDWVIPHED
jgi:hypothetical protein